VAWRNGFVKRKFLKTGEVAELLRKTPAAVRMAVLRRQIPVFKAGRTLLFDETEILEWIANQKRITLVEALKRVK
jgi:hypothetical protein